MTKKYVNTKYDISFLQVNFQVFNIFQNVLLSILDNAIRFHWKIVEVERLDVFVSCKNVNNMKTLAKTTINDIQIIVRKEEYSCLF